MSLLRLHGLVQLRPCRFHLRSDLHHTSPFTSLTSRGIKITKEKSKVEKVKPFVKSPSSTNKANKQVTTTPKFRQESFTNFKKPQTLASTLSSSNLPTLKKADPHKLRTFEQTNLSQEVINAVKQAFPEIQLPTPTQSQSIPEILKRKRDVILAAQTGTGKTLAYLLPVIHLLKLDEANGVERRPSRPRALIILPNRELCRQVVAVAKSLGHHVKLRILELVGGERKGIQINSLEHPVDIVVSTPGRLLQHKEKEKLFLTDVKHFVVDEADTMFEKDFGEDIEKILLPIRGRNPELPTYVGPTRTIIATATLPAKVIDLIKKNFPDAVSIATPQLHMTLDHLQQEFIRVEGGDKHAALLKVMKATKGQRVIVFCNTVPSCRSTDHFLNEEGFKCANFHGDILPRTREMNWNSFISGEAPVLVATDIASRGLDTTMVDHVVLFDFPMNSTDYLHRIGRTGRSGRKGKVTSLITKKDRELAEAIQRAIKSGEPLDQYLAADRKKVAAPEPETKPKLKF